MTGSDAQQTGPRVGERRSRSAPHRAQRLATGRMGVSSGRWSGPEPRSQASILHAAAENWYDNDEAAPRRGQAAAIWEMSVKNMSGALYLLPYVAFDRDGYTFEKDGKTYWTKDATVFGKRFVKAIVDLDRATRQNSGITPMPTWVSGTGAYSLPAETTLNARLLKLAAQIEVLNTEKNAVLDQLSNETTLKGLLYEKGTRLESAIIQALGLLGFEASQYRECDSEFDVVFVCDEGRMIGEAEGKDSKAINVDKLRQLEMNIHEDFERDAVDTPAKGVLIGNAFRLTPPDKRGEFFTQKCVIAAGRSRTALIRSTDLFGVARYLSGKRDARFAERCRAAIVKTVGIVKFPDIPKSKTPVSRNDASP